MTTNTIMWTSRHCLGSMTKYLTIPVGRPPDRGFEHVIELEGGNLMITTPYRNPKEFKDKIEKTI
jgi:hypothetical protein